VKPSDAIADARVILNDPGTGTPRWSDEVLLGYFNDFLRAFAKAQPVYFAMPATITLSAGELQSVSTETTNGLLDILKNKASQSVRRVDRAALDNSLRAWRRKPAGAMDSWAMLAAGDPFRFLVYPPAAANDTAQAMVAAVPAAVESAAITANLVTVPSTFKPAFASYIAGRALAVNTGAADTEKGLVLIGAANREIGAA